MGTTPSTMVDIKKIGDRGLNFWGGGGLINKDLLCEILNFSE